MQALVLVFSHSLASKKTCKFPGTDGDILKAIGVNL